MKTWIVEINDRGDRYEVTEGYDPLVEDEEHHIKIDMVTCNGEVRQTVFRQNGLVAGNLAMMIQEAVKENAQRRVAHEQRMADRDAKQTGRGEGKWIVDGDVAQWVVEGESPRQIHEPEFCAPSDDPPWADDEPPVSVEERRKEKRRKKDETGLIGGRRGKPGKVVKVMAVYAVRVCGMHGDDCTCPLQPKQVLIKSFGTPTKTINNAFYCKRCALVTLSQSSREVPCAKCGVGGTEFLGTETVE